MNANKKQRQPKSSLFVMSNHRVNQPRTCAKASCTDFLKRLITSSHSSWVMVFWVAGALAAVLGKMLLHAVIHTANAHKVLAWLLLWSLSSLFWSWYSLGWWVLMGWLGLVLWLSFYSFDCHHLFSMDNLRSIFTKNAFISSPISMPKRLASTICHQMFSHSL